MLLHHWSSSSLGLIINTYEDKGGFSDFDTWCVIQICDSFEFFSLKINDPPRLSSRVETGWPLQSQNNNYFNQVCLFKFITSCWHIGYILLEVFLTTQRKSEFKQCHFGPGLPLYSERGGTAILGQELEGSSPSSMWGGVLPGQLCPSRNLIYGRWSSGWKLKSY